MKLPRRQFLHLAAGAAALPAVSRFAWAQAYPTRPVRIIVGFRCRRLDRHRRAPDRSMAVGAARPAIHHREPAGRRQQYRPPRRSCVRPRTATRSSWSVRRTQSTRRSTKSSISISSATSRRSQASAAMPYVMVVNPSVPAKTVPEFIAYAKANPGKINMASAGNGTAHHLSGELFKMMTGVNMVHVPYRGAAPALTDLLGGQVQVMFDTMPSSIEHIRAGKLRAIGGDNSNALGGAAGRPDRRRFRAGLRGERVERRRRAQEHAHRNRRQAQQGDQRGPRRSQDQGAARRPGRHGACRLARRLRQAHRRRDREVGQGGQVLRRQAGLICGTRRTFHNPVPRMAGVRLRGRLDRMTRLFCCSENTSLHSRPCNFLASIGPTTDITELYLVVAG